MISEHGLSQRRACDLVDVSRTVMHYQPKLSELNERLRKRLKELAEKHRRYGHIRLHVLIRREGCIVNHKRTERLYRAEGLSLRIRRRRKFAAVVRNPLPPATKQNERWAMDFVSDALSNGRKIRLLTLIDEYTRECLAIEVDTSINGVRVTNVLSRIAMVRGLPNIIKVDNGPEFIGKALDAWAYERGVQLRFSRPGKPVDNRFIESFNGRLRDECLNDNWFMSLQEARNIIEGWRVGYNTERPHSSLDDLTPSEFFEKEQEKLQLELVQSTG
jgi:putative transposase